MEVDIDTSLDTENYGHWLKELQNMEEAHARIMEQLPAEHRAFLEKYEAVYGKMWEAYGKMAYVTGYHHSRKTPTK